MMVSIITVVYNGEKTIRKCIESVVSQTYNDIEYIVIDGKSSDCTLDIVNQYRDQISVIVSEADNGIYDAMNKGIRLARGELIGTLNADDFFIDNGVIRRIADYHETNEADCYYFDLIMVGSNGLPIRYWKTGELGKRSFETGWIPPHPTFYAKRVCYEKYGFFDTSFKIAADYDLIFRFLKIDKLKTLYKPEVIVGMAVGGTSNKRMKNILKGNLEIWRIWKKYNLRQPMILFNISKAIRRMKQYINKGEFQKNLYGS